MRELGYADVPLEDLIRLRDHGVSASFVREQNAGPRGCLSVDELVRRRVTQYHRGRIIKHHPPSLRVVPRTAWPEARLRAP